jgi:hypothetical protein
MFFSSDRAEGLGGFDIYFSHFDTVQQSWTNPVNAGFPVNSPYDDFLFLPGDGMQPDLLFSNRHVDSDSAVIFYIQKIGEPLAVIPGTTGQLFSLASFSSWYMLPSDGIIPEFNLAKFPRKKLPVKADREEWLRILDQDIRLLDSASLSLDSISLRCRNISSAKYSTSAKFRIEAEKLNQQYNRLSDQDQREELECKRVELLERGRILKEEAGFAGQYQHEVEARSRNLRAQISAFQQLRSAIVTGSLKNGDVAVLIQKQRDQIIRQPLVLNNYHDDYLYLQKWYDEVAAQRELLIDSVQRVERWIITSETDTSTNKMEVMPDSAADLQSILQVNRASLEEKNLLLETIQNRMEMLALLIAALKE